MKYISFLLLLMLSGCAFALLASTPQTSNVKDVIKFNAPRPEFMETVSEMGKKDGFDVRKSACKDGVLDPSIGKPLAVELRDGFGLGDSMAASMTGRVKGIVMTFESTDNGVVWNCHTAMVGNFDAGKEDAALRYWAGFKTRLLRRVGERFGDCLDMGPDRKPEKIVATDPPKPAPTKPAKARLRPRNPEIIEAP